jgi:hypothetical protein
MVRGRDDINRFAGTFSASSDEGRVFVTLCDFTDDARRS